MITLFLTRHAKSTRNYYDEKGSINHNYNITENTFHDTALCPEGIESVILQRQKLQENIGSVDFIMTSPMKRCIQTCLATYEKKSYLPPIYVFPLLTEFGNRPDSIGKSMIEISSDPDIFEYNHYKSLDFQSIFLESVPITNPVDVMKNTSWMDSKFLLDSSRIHKFVSFLKKNFLGKKIHAFTHSGFIKHFLGINANNYQTFCVVIDTINNKFTWEHV